MAWIPVYQSLLTHRKTLNASALLGIPEAHTIGYLVTLWLWAVDNATDGELPKDERVIARAVGWTGDSMVFVAALRTAGFLDEWTIHNWDDYTGRLIEKREANRERMRAQRAAHNQRTTNAQPAHVQGLQYSTVQYSTEDNSTREEAPLEKSSSKKSRSSKKPVWDPPEWFLPLTQLEGYKRGDHSKAAQIIRQACVNSTVDKDLVVSDFCQYWPTGKLVHGNWHTPVATLLRTIDIQLSKTRNGSAQGRGSADSPSGPDYDAPLVDNFKARATYLSGRGDRYG